MREGRCVPFPSYMYHFTLQFTHAAGLFIFSFIHNANTESVAVIRVYSLGNNDALLPWLVGDDHETRQTAL